MSSIYLPLFFFQVFLSKTNLFRLKFLRQTFLLLIIMFCLSFGLVLLPLPLPIYLFISHDLYRSYGIILWYPTYINEITTQKDTHDLPMFCNTTTSFSLEDNMMLYCDCTSTVFQDTSFSLPELKDWKSTMSCLEMSLSSMSPLILFHFNGTEFTECKFQNCTFTRLLFNATVFNDLQFKSVKILATSLSLFKYIRGCSYSGKC